MIADLRDDHELLGAVVSRAASTRRPPRRDVTRCLGAGGSRPSRRPGTARVLPSRSRRSFRRPRLARRIERDVPGAAAGAEQHATIVHPRPAERSVAVLVVALVASCDLELETAVQSSSSAPSAGSSARTTTSSVLARVTPANRRPGSRRGRRSPRRRSRGRRTPRCAAPADAVGPVPRERAMPDARLAPRTPPRSAPPSATRRRPRADRRTAGGCPRSESGCSASGRRDSRRAARRRGPPAARRCRSPRRASAGPRSTGLARSLPAKRRAAAHARDERESGARREDAMTRGGDGALARRQVAEAHAAADALARPVPERERVGRPCARRRCGSRRSPRRSSPAARAARRRAPRRAACTRRRSASGRPASGARRVNHQSRTGYGKPCAPSTSTRSSGVCSSLGSTSCDGPISKRTREWSMPRRSACARMRVSSPASGVTATWSAPPAANASVLEPAPVSSVAIPGRTSRSSHSQRRPREPPELVALAVQPGRQRPELVGDRASHRSIIAACPSGARSITGIGGQDGSLLAELLLDQGYEVFGIGRRSASSYPNLAATHDRIELIQADLKDQLALVRALRACRPHEVYNLASVSFVPVSWDSAGAHCRARRGRRDGAARGDSRGRLRDSLLPGVLVGDLRRAGRDAAVGGDAARAAHALRRREGVRALHHALVPAPLRPARVRGDPLQPRVAAAPARVRAEQDRERGGGDQARAARRGVARRPLGAARLGLRRRLRPGDVADAPAGRAGRLRHRHG